MFTRSPTVSRSGCRQLPTGKVEWELQDAKTNNAISQSVAYDFQFIREGETILRGENCVAGQSRLHKEDGSVQRFPYEGSAQAQLEKFFELLEDKYDLDP